MGLGEAGPDLERPCLQAAGSFFTNRIVFFSLMAMAVAKTVIKQHKKGQNLRKGRCMPVWAASDRMSVPKRAGDPDFGSLRRRTESSLGYVAPMAPWEKLSES